MQLNVTYDFLPKRKTTRAGQVMDHFGIQFETGPHVLVDRFELPIEHPAIYCFTGDSGSGKSSLMRVLSGQLPGVLALDELPLEQKPLVDCMPVSLEKSLELFASCGLSEAQLMLRTPAELSDGQRYRFRLARAIAAQPQWILADEFTATLDRTLAKVIAFNLRKLCDREQIGFLLATTHEDMLADLNPDFHIRCRLGQPPELHRESSTESSAESSEANLPLERPARKKKASAFSTSSGSARAPNPTGRISLGGIIAATPSAS